MGSCSEKEAEDAALLQKAAIKRRNDFSQDPGNDTAMESDVGQGNDFCPQKYGAEANGCEVQPGDATPFCCWYPRGSSCCDCLSCVKGNMGQSEPDSCRQGGQGATMCSWCVNGKK